LTAGAEYDVPPDQRGEASDINFSPDSKEICFTAVTDKVEATSTNGDLFRRAGERRRGKADYDAAGVRRKSRVFAGWEIHCVSRAVNAGYEADRWRVMLYDARQGKAEI